MNDIKFKRPEIVKIIVEGPSNSGLAAMSVLIAELLNERGIATAASPFHNSAMANLGLNQDTCVGILQRVVAGGVRIEIEAKEPIEKQHQSRVPTYAVFGVGGYTMVLAAGGIPVPRALPSPDGKSLNAPIPSWIGAPGKGLISKRAQAVLVNDAQGEQQTVYYEHLLEPIENGAYRLVLDRLTLQRLLINAQRIFGQGCGGILSEMLILDQNHEPMSTCNIWTHFNSNDTPIVDTAIYAISRHGHLNSITTTAA